MTRRSATTATAAVAAKATEAADTLMVWLQTQPRAADGISSDVAPHVADPVAAAGTAAPGTEPTSVARITPPAPGNPAGAATPAPLPDLGRTDRHAPLRLAHTDWLHHRLLVTGPAADLDGFRSVAAGAGTVPWQLDLDRMAEDFFHLWWRRRPAPAR
jgi:hypothetical protein